MRTAGIEGRRSARELAEAEGFRVEDHHAVTTDGFVLVLHRVLDPNGVSRSRANFPSAVVAIGVAFPPGAALERTFRVTVATKDEFYCCRSRTTPLLAIGD